MSLENTRISLVRALREWRSALQQVERALDDHPVADPTDPGQDRLAIMDDLADSVLEVIGRIEDAMTALERVNTARSGSIVLDLWRTTLPMLEPKSSRAFRQRDFGFSGVACGASLDFPRAANSISSERTIGGVSESF